MHTLHQPCTVHTSFLFPLTVPLSALMHTSHLTTAKTVTRIVTLIFILAIQKQVGLQGKG